MQDRNQTCHAHGAHRSIKNRSTCNCVSGHQLPTPKRSATYRSGKLLWLSCLPALLADWRQGGVDSGYVVGGKAPVQLPTHIARVRAGRLGAKGAAQRRGEAEASERRLLLAGGAKAAAVANAGGKGHGQLEIHCTTVSTSVSRIIITSVGLGAVREGCCSCARCACPPEQRTQQRVRRRTGAGRTQASYSYSYSYTGPVPSVAVKEWTRMRAIVGLADVGVRGLRWLYPRGTG